MKRILMATAFAALLTSLPTMAASFSSVNLNNFNYTLIDLDLEDGITPSVTFTPYFEYFFASTRGEDNSFSNNYTFSTNGQIDATRSTSSLINTASGTVTGNSFINKEMNVNGISLGNTYEFGYQSIISNASAYNLSANTELKISAEVRSTVGITAGGNKEEVASTYARLQVSDNQKIYDEDKKELFALSLVNGSPFSLSELTLLSVAITNLGGQDLTGALISFIRVDGFSSASKIEYPVSSVPIPAALPLMASALGVFGIARRRNKSKAV